MKSGEVLWTIERWAFTYNTYISAESAVWVAGQIQTEANVVCDLHGTRDNKQGL